MKNCPYCNRETIYTSYLESHDCNNDDHEFSLSTDNKGLWLLCLKQEGIQIGKCGSGNYIMFTNSHLKQDLFDVKDFTFNDVNNIINKARRMKAFL